MGWFVLITAFAGLILYRVSLIYYISKNRRELSPDFPEQLRRFRVIMALTLSLTLAGIFTLIILDFVKLSTVASIAVWVGMYAVWVAVMTVVARRTVTEWFRPFSHRPGTQSASQRWTPGRIIFLVILLILILLLRFDILL